jgi:hypothetical protein
MASDHHPGSPPCSFLPSAGQPPAPPTRCAQHGEACARDGAAQHNDAVRAWRRSAPVSAKGTPLRSGTKTHGLQQHAAMLQGKVSGASQTSFREKSLPTTITECSGLERVRNANEAACFMARGTPIRTGTYFTCRFTACNCNTLELVALGASRLGRTRCTSFSPRGQQWRNRMHGPGILLARAAGTRLQDMLGSRFQLQRRPCHHFGRSSRPCGVRLPVSKSEVGFRLVIVETNRQHVSCLWIWWSGSSQLHTLFWEW